MPFSLTSTVPSSTNIYVPSYDESARVIVQFARDPKKWLINRLSKIASVEKEIGDYRVWDPSEYSRISADPAYAKWVDGMEFPQGYDREKPYGAFRRFVCQRHALPIWLGYREKENSPFDLTKTYFDALAMKLMTLRTKAWFNVAFDPNNHLSTHVSTATALGGGLFSAATSVNNYIQKCFNAIGQRIELATNGVVEYTQLTAVMSPAVARAMGASQEIRDYLAQQAGSLDWLQGRNAVYGLPEYLYGIKIEVDTTVQNLGNREGTPDRSYVASNDSIVFVVRQGDMEGNVSENNFASMVIFTLKGMEMVTQTFDEFWNKRYRLSIEDWWDIQLVSPWSSFLLTNVI